jgi:4-amino-4-deoxy-L-arabinose transferase-like glycosyltransferase
LYWRFSVSGLSTIFLIVLFLSLVVTLLAMERGLREATISQGKAITYAAIAGVLLGGMTLTRYSMGVLIFPVLGFLAWIGGAKRIPLMVLAGLIFLGSLGSWAYRNYELSGTLFGTAGFAIYQETPQMPGNKLERSMPKNLSLELDKVGPSHIFRKLMVESAQLLKNAVPRLGESWLASFFLVSLLVTFKSEAIKKLRVFSIVTLLLLLLAQAAGKTSLSEAAPDVNSENLLAVFAPLAFIFGAAMFFILLDAIEWSIPPLRPIMAGGFVLICAAPLIFLLLPPRETSIAYPPYYPPLIQETASWLEPNEMMMSDMPWAIAWYGDRKCMWTTLDSGSDSQGDFFAINDYQKPINALFLSPLTMDSKFLTEMVQGKEGAWGRFVLDGLLRTNVPTGFPLKQAPKGFLPAHLYLSDRPRWKNAQK